MRVGATVGAGVGTGCVGCGWAVAMGKLGEFGLEAKPNEPHSAPNGGKAVFIEPSKTRGMLWEMTGGA